MMKSVLSQPIAFIPLVEAFDTTLTNEYESAKQYQNHRHRLRQIKPTIRTLPEISDSAKRSRKIEKIPSEKKLIFPLTRSQDSNPKKTLKEFERKEKIIRDNEILLQKLKKIATSTPSKYAFHSTSEPPPAANAERCRRAKEIDRKNEHERIKESNKRIMNRLANVKGSYNAKDIQKSLIVHSKTATRNSKRRKRTQRQLIRQKKEEKTLQEQIEMDDQLQFKLREYSLLLSDQYVNRYVEGLDSLEIHSVQNIKKNVHVRFPSIKNQLLTIT